MSDLNEMWAALEKYQPYADKAGHGESWKRMVTERTVVAALDAGLAIRKVAGSAAAMRATGKAGYAVDAVIHAANGWKSLSVTGCANQAIEYINRAIEEQQ